MEKGNPKISIITITYNSEKTVEETIKSVLSQNYNNLEYLIIDGGSSDHTLEIVEKYKAKIAVVISEPDKGISDAFNKGIEHATGDIIGIINSDDYLCEGALVELAIAYKPEIDVYRGNLIIWNEVTGKKLFAKPSMVFPVNRKIKKVCHPSTFISSIAYKKWGMYNVDYKYMMDVDILYRFYQKGATFHYINKNLAQFRLGGATSDNWKRKRKELKVVLTGNGCPALIVFFRLCSYSLYHTLKNSAFRVLGEDTVRKCRYSNER